MDDLIVIILTLIFAAAGVFGQMKKKQAERNNEGLEEEPEGADNFWDLLEEEGEQPQKRQEVMKQKQRVTKETEASPVAAKASPARGKQIADTSVYNDDLTGGTQKTVQRKRRQRDRFPLRKAVIYSEILNRKYS